MSLSGKLIRYFGDRRWSLTGEDYDGLEWLDEDAPKPTLEELDALAWPAPPQASAEVRMHKVHKAALLTPWPGYPNLKAAIEAGIDLLPAPSNALARIEWDKAENLVRDGVTTAAVMAILDMTEAQRDELLIFADSLP